MQQITFQGLGKAPALTSMLDPSISVWTTEALMDMPLGKQAAVTMQFAEDSRLMLAPRKLYQHPILAGIVGLAGGVALGMLLKK